MTSDLLFDAPEQPSPRLAWMRKHGVKTHKSPCVAEGDEPWSAWCGDLQEAIEKGGDNPKAGGYATANTEEEAIADLAIARGLKLWNEEEVL